MSINTSASVTAVWVTQAFINVLIAEITSPAGGTDTNGPHAFWMVETVGRVSKRAGVTIA